MKGFFTSLVMLSIPILRAIEFSIVSVSAMNSFYSEGYSAILDDGNKIEVTCCKFPGLMNGIVRLSLFNSNIVAKGNEKFRNISANDWFSQLKDMHTKQQQNKE